MAGTLVGTVLSMFGESRDCVITGDCRDGSTGDCRDCITGDCREYIMGAYMLAMGSCIGLPGGGSESSLAICWRCKTLEVRDSSKSSLCLIEIILATKKNTATPSPMRITAVRMKDHPDINFTDSRSSRSDLTVTAGAGGA
jgi:hypothetical protein